MYDCTCCKLELGFLRTVCYRNAIVHDYNSEYIFQVMTIDYKQSYISYSKKDT